ncbi:hypothetical protein FOXG_22647 [Fusarium oxysporum f. sp. lycopersici 4287]|uniref:Uncharacterized protein n=2 Tax=Fusarium oxysporum TaxID=5507 RepID=W9HTC6_FUSOX|nr:uncharacterized protein FOXG_22647 [Fusarium oxysporum f. sp. lycopersici 4287]EWY84260.1 hypothetical protein FOYG_14018 [Fusarium oxysporum NRRL 32931]KNB19792.1 hypothetical protein FOXG_22647 [Fusarium oxysporum f. sp. lycopersici 4287]
MTEDTGHNDEARIASNSSPEKVTPTETWGSRGHQLLVRAIAQDDNFIVVRPVRLRYDAKMALIPRFFRKILVLSLKVPLLGTSKYGAALALESSKNSTFPPQKAYHTASNFPYHFQLAVLTYQ